MAEVKEQKDVAPPEARGRVVKEEVKRTRVGSSGDRRRRRRGVLFRGSVFEGIYQATLEGMRAASDALRNTVDGFSDRDREDRDRGRGRLGGIASNCVDAGWNAYDGITSIPRRAWNAYRDELDASNDEDDEDTGT